MAQPRLVLLVNLGKHRVETACCQILLNLLVSHLSVMILEPVHQLSQIRGWQLGNGTLNSLDAHILDPVPFSICKPPIGGYSCYQHNCITDEDWVQRRFAMSMHGHGRWTFLPWTTIGILQPLQMQLPVRRATLALTGIHKVPPREHVPKDRQVAFAVPRRSTRR